MMTAESVAETSDSNRRRTLGTGRFQLIADIGEGGTARVQLAAAAGPGGFNKLVVLKTLRDNLASDPDIASMFRHEARLAARMNHPNIVQTYEVIDDAGRQVMVMEYLDGQPLSQIVSQASKNKVVLPRALHLRILCDTLAGIHYAHELSDFSGVKLGLVHRDVSPQNVFVTYEGQVKVLDFGIAKAVEGASTHTELGVIKGKIRYMAPEQMSGAQLDRRADIFAVGIMLWEALAGKRLWSRLSDVAVMTSVINGEIPPLSEAAPDAPEDLARICAKAIAMKPGDRYETAQQFEFELEKAMKGIEEAKRRDLGNFVSELFANKRAEMQSVIELSLSAVAGPISSTPLREPGEVSGSSATTSPSVLPQQETTKVDAKPNKNGRRAVLTALPILLLVLIGWVTLGRRNPPRQPDLVVPSGTPLLTTPAAPSSSAATAATEVELRITVSPDEAHLVLDGKDLRANPFVGSFPPDDAKHTLHIEAAGYVARDVDVVLSKSSSVALVLDHAKGAPIGPHIGGRPLPIVKGTASPVAPNCAQPYFIDEQGIKRIRVECL
jgi:serine/threonine protein kinase